MTGGCQTVASWSSGLFKQARLHLSEGVLKIKDLFACYEGVPQGSILGPIHAFFNNQPDKKKNALFLLSKVNVSHFHLKTLPFHIQTDIQKVPTQKLASLTSRVIPSVYP